MRIQSQIPRVLYHYLSSDTVHNCYVELSREDLRLMLEATVEEGEGL